MKGSFSAQKSAPVHTHNAAEVVRKGPPQLLRDTIAAVIDSGAAIMFSATRDGGTVIVTLLSGDERAKAYADSVDAWRQVITDAAASVEP